ncbi:MAG: hypothetical protein DWQ10_18460 [Calditrichaeota bacterium]|nr:MAG: hypothetical protein DWQ10_18460 [Calditrichota bacterium]
MIRFFIVVLSLIADAPVIIKKIETSGRISFRFEKFTCSNQKLDTKMSLPAKQDDRAHARSKPGKRNIDMHQKSICIEG